LSLVFIGQLLHLLNTPKDIYNDALIFISILLAGLVAIMVYNLAANTLRAVGNSKVPLYFLILAVFVNIALELLFIVIFKWGIAGAAFATVIAETFSGLIGFIYIYRAVPELAVRPKDFKWDKDDIREHFRMGLPMAFQNSVLAIGGLVLTAALNSLGTDAVASSAAAQRIDQLATLPMMSLGTAVATYVAQNLGAKLYSRIKSGVIQSLIAANVWAILMGIVEIVFGHIRVKLFIGNSNPRVIELSNTYFWVIGSMYVFLATLFTIRYALQGLGNAKVPTTAAFVELALRVIGAIVLVSLFKYAGAVGSNPLAWIGATIILIPAWLNSYNKLSKLTDGQEIDRQLNPIE
jgi:putative MATE family efflux protein